jgi:hypothetical protein
MHANQQDAAARPAGLAGRPDPDEPVYMGLPHERVLRTRFYVSLALTVPVLVLAMGPMGPPGCSWP